MRGALLLAVLAAPAAAQDELSPFTRNVLLHVLLHEGGHAVIDDFAIPVLANEEDMADAFATAAILRLMADEAEAILKDRARSWMVETEERGWPGAGADPFEDPLSDIWGEHRLDAQRAFDAMCLLYGAGPAERGDVPAWFGMSGNDATACSNYAPATLDGWLAVLSPHLRHARPGEPSPMVEVVYGDGPLAPLVRASGVAEDAAGILGVLGWDAPLAIVVDGCDEEAWWDGESRSIMLCDAYVARFMAQEARAIPP